MEHCINLVVVRTVMVSNDIGLWPHSKILVITRSSAVARTRAVPR